MSAEHRAPLAASMIVIVASALVPFYPYVFAIRPQLQEREREAEAQVFELDKRLEQARAAQRKYPQFREELSRLDAELVKMTLVMPPEDRLGQQVERDALRHGLKLIGVEPLKSPAHEIYTEHPYDVTVRGPISAIHDFLLEYWMPSPLVTTSRIELKRDGDAWRATPRLTSYNFVK